MKHEYTSNQLPVRLTQQSDNESWVTKYILSDGLHQALPINLHLTSKYVVVSIDERPHYIFNLLRSFLRKLNCDDTRMMWTTAVWDDTLVSEGNEQDIMVWNLNTGLKHSPLLVSNHSLK